MSKKRVGVMLAGCGYLDGAEIQEAVLTLLYLDQAGVEAVCMAPDIPQAHVMNHLTGEEEANEARNVLVESARIARGKIAGVDKVDPATLDALILPGGFGVAKNSCTFAFDGTDMKVDPGVEKMVRAVHEAGKPVGAWCIAPAMIAKLFPGTKVTIGNDEGTAQAIEAMGAAHENCDVGNAVIDGDKRVVTTAAYMYDAWTADVARGIEKAVDDVLGLIE